MMLSTSGFGKFGSYLLGAVIAGMTLVGCSTMDAGKSASQKNPIVETMTLSKDQVYGADTPKLPESTVQPVGDTPPPVSTEEARAAVFDYHIGPADVLDFHSFDDEYLSRQVVVRYDGYVSLPLVPDIKVSDMTRDEATDAVRAAYQKVFVDPQMTLTVVQVNSKQYYVMGDVARPDTYTYTRPISLLDAINTAGGMRVNTRGGDSFVGAQGQLTRAYVIRHVGEQRDVFEYDLRGLRNPGAHAADAPVFPGDVVYVPEGINLVYLIGAVQRPDVYALSEGMGVVELLARAGGPIESTARMGHALLIRDRDESTSEIMQIDLQVVMRMGKDIPLKPGDVIYVPRKPMIPLQEFVGRITGTISPALDLYTQAYDAYYTDRQYDELFKDTSSGVLDIVQTLRTLGLRGLTP